MYLEQLKSITTWDYCKLAQQNDEEDFYQFGWKHGLHFYLCDYRTVDELGQFYLICYLKGETISNVFCKVFEDVKLEIEKLLKNFN